MLPEKPSTTTRSVPTPRSAREVAPKSERSGVFGSDAMLATFRQECEVAIESIRAAVKGLGNAASSDPTRPQEVSRRFGINKNLTWKFARVLSATDAFDAITMLPGPEGVEIYLRAFAAGGTPEQFTAELRFALKRFDALADRHFGSRAELELVLDGLRTDGTLENARRMAFRGMAVVFGVQARARLTAQIVQPKSSDPRRANVAMLVGLAGLRRLRPIGALPIFRASSDQPGFTSAPLFGGDAKDATNYLAREFSTIPNSKVHTFESGERLSVALGEGPIGRSGDSDMIFGTLLPDALSLHAEPGDTTAGFSTAVSIPSESLVSDLFVHKSIPVLESLRASMHATLSTPLPSDRARQAACRLPIDCTPLLMEDLSVGFPLEQFGQYEAMVLRAFEVLKANPADYRLARVAMAFPPVPSALLVEWDLPE